MSSTKLRRSGGTAPCRLVGRQGGEEISVEATGGRAQRGEQSERSRRKCRMQMRHAFAPGGPCRDMGRGRPESARSAVSEANALEGSARLPLGRGGGIGRKGEPTRSTNVQGAVLSWNGGRRPERCRTKGQSTIA